MTGDPAVSGEQRSRIMHAIRDMTADAFGGWHYVTNVQSGGGLYAQRIITRKHYPMEAALAMAREAVGLEEAEAAAPVAAPAPAVAAEAGR
jgi:4-hydroxybutyryl-CoA dehydratase/vinylacetyl-CoA-Delta-isomerase